MSKSKGEEVAVLLAEIVLSAVSVPKQTAKRRLRRPANVPHCVAPGCKKPHKGPRFDFCCEFCRTAPKKTRKLWVAEARARRKAAKKG